MKLLVPDSFSNMPMAGDRRSFSSMMSTDTDDEGPTMTPHSSHDIDESSSDMILREESVGEEAMNTMLITANVGSIFEDSDRLVPSWRQEVLKHVAATRAKFVAIHFQEVGGKNIDESSLDTVRDFVEKLLEGAAALGFDRHSVFFDQNYHATDKFTALGNLYLVHNTVANVEIYDFKSECFFPFDSSHFHVDRVERVSLCEKHKFPIRFFPDGRWSRKGYLRTRWRIQGTPVDLVNVHLFHDACNLTSLMQEGPSVYRESRRRVLQYALDRMHNDQHENLPFFVFGDFNFRLEGNRVVKKLSRGLSRPNSIISQDSMQNETAPEDIVHFSDQSDQIILTIGKKAFQLMNQEEVFCQEWPQWTDLDIESGSVDERLTERALSFPPTYPYAEDPDSGAEYMGTRCPAWCDRVLFSHPAKELFDIDDEDDITYNVIGTQVCMGDHKPVFLQFPLKANCNQVRIPDYRRFRSPTEDAGKPRVESPTYTDLLGNNTIPCTRYIEVTDVNQVKLFKETTV